MSAPPPPPPFGPGNWCPPGHVHRWTTLTAREMDKYTTSYTMIVEVERVLGSLGILVQHNQGTERAVRIIQGDWDRCHTAYNQIAASAANSFRRADTVKALTDSYIGKKLNLERALPAWTHVSNWGRPAFATAQVPYPSLPAPASVPALPAPAPVRVPAPSPAPLPAAPLPAAPPPAAPLLPILAGPLNGTPAATGFEYPDPEKQDRGPYAPFYGVE